MVAIPQRLLGEALQISARKNPLKPAIIIKDKEFSYEKLLDGAEKIAAHLIHSGIQKGDRIAICMSNSRESILAIYGATLSGAVFLFINPQTKANKLQYILNDCGAKILFAEAVLSNELSPALEDAKTVEQVIISGSSDKINKQVWFEIQDFENIILTGKSNVQFPV